MLIENGYFLLRSADDASAPAGFRIEPTIWTYPIDSTEDDADEIVGMKLLFLCRLRRDLEGVDEHLRSTLEVSEEFFDRYWIVEHIPDGDEPRHLFEDMVLSGWLSKEEACRIAGLMKRVDRSILDK